jgi:electron transport complex protein RnfG
VSAPVASPARERDEPSAARLVLTLGLAGLLSGLAIVTAYDLTLPTITAHKAEALRQAVFRVLPGVTRMQRLVFAEGTWRAGAAGTGGEAIYGGYDGTGRLVGYAIPAEGAGFQDTISLIYGYRPDRGRIVGMEVLDSRETPGLGDKIYKDAAFRANFDDLAVSPPVVAVKRGTRAAPNQVDAITGATISSNAVVKILNNTNATWLERLPAPGEEPPLAQTGGGE